MSTDTVAWFEVATDDAEGTQEFYGELFGWTFAPDPTAGELDYRLITYRGGEAPAGGLMVTGPGTPGHAVFYVAVDDVAEACARTEKLGGSVVLAVTEPGAGVAFAHLRDRTGNQFGVFTPRPAG